MCRPGTRSASSAVSARRASTPPTAARAPMKTSTAKYVMARSLVLRAMVTGKVPVYCKVTVTPTGEN